MAVFLVPRSIDFNAMKTLNSRSFLICCLLGTSSISGADRPPLEPQLEPLRPFLDKTWKGAFKDSRPENPIVDVMRWERALNGKAVRVLHSVNEGAYGGETIFRWDTTKQAVTYYYFTTAGFMTVGSASFKDGKVITHEVVTGSSGGVSEVRGTSELLPDGKIHVKTEHLKDNEWQVGREVTYNEDPGSKVIFK
jgi:hypothetical protein